MAQVIAPVRPPKWLWTCAGLSTALGAAGTCLGFAWAFERAYYAYLWAFCYVVSIAVGALVLLMIGYAANARWMSVIRRMCELIALLVVPLLVLFIPIALGVKELYLWADPPADLSAAHMELLHKKAPYLNVPGFVARALGYFAIWIISAGLLHRWSRRRRAGGDGSPEEALGRERMFSSGMLPAVAVALTFASFDWLMSLFPFWLSSMFGVYYFAGGFVAAIALVAIIANLARRRGLVGPSVITGHHFHALGRLLFAFTIFWAYAAYFQVFLIKIADMPAEISFYLIRSQGSWLYTGWALIILHFAVPFLLLLPRRLKHRSGYVSTIAVWLLFAHLVDLYFVVMPVASPSSAMPHWVDGAVLLTFIGVPMLWCMFVQRDRSLVSETDPFLPEGMAYASKS